MCRLRSTSQGLRLVQPASETQRSEPLQRPVGVLFLPLPIRVFPGHGKNGGTNDRPQ